MGNRLRRLRSLARDVWSLTVPYWRSEDRWRGLGLLAAIVAMTLGLVYLLVLLNTWNGEFYNALEERDFSAFQYLLLQFCGLVSVYIIVAVYKNYLTQMLEMRWRAWMTRRFTSQWLDRQAYYHLELRRRETDNPDQRIAEDLRNFTAGTLGLALGLLSSTVTLVSFVAILWRLSGPLSFTIGAVAVTIPGYMVWVAVVYAIVGSVLTHTIGRRLVPLNVQQERFEADFRFSLIRVRENAEAIALYRGEAVETRGLSSRFGQIQSNWREIMRYTKRLTMFTVGYGQVASIFPILVAAPQYFAGAITLGGLMQIASAFGRVEGALSWFVNGYDGLANWKASVDRLLAFRVALDEAAGPAAAGRRLELVTNTAPGIRADGLALAVPGGPVITSELGFDIQPGDRVLVHGPSGSGKSTLFRAIAGIWPFGQGRIHVPHTARALFLPQKPYIPIMSLRGALAYPAAEDTYPDPAIHDALIAARLDGLIGRLDETQHWSLRLSGGEQQRLALARAMLHRPDWLFMDEATSALDPATEQQVLTALVDRLPTTTIVSITHRTGLAVYHDRVVEVAGCHDAAQGRPAELVSPPEATRTPQSATRLATAPLASGD